MNCMIRFQDFFKEIDASNTKVKFNMNNGNPNEPAWDYLRDDCEQWIGMNSWKTKQSNNNFTHAKYVLAFAQYYPYGPNYFIFGGLYKIEKITPKVWNTHGYKLILLDEFKEYRKRLIIKLEKPIGRNLYNRWFECVQNDLNPAIACKIQNIAFMSTAPQFREAIAPVYYRRKREDVLTENYQIR